MSWGTMFTFLHEVQIFLDRVQMLLEASKLNYFASIIIKGTAPGEKCFYRGYFLGTTDSFLPELGTPHFLVPPQRQRNNVVAVRGEFE